VLAGEADTCATPEAMITLAKRIPGATYELLTATSHQAALTQPTLVADALGAFLPYQPAPGAPYTPDSTSVTEGPTS
jgi:pimeloyl-ACP methyl ester carboxylesterase